MDSNLVLKLMQTELGKYIGESSIFLNSLSNGTWIIQIGFWIKSYNNFTKALLGWKKTCSCSRPPTTIVVLSAAPLPA